MNETEIALIISTIGNVSVLAYWIYSWALKRKDLLSYDPVEYIRSGDVFGENQNVFQIWQEGLSLYFVVKEMDESFRGFGRMAFPTKNGFFAVISGLIPQLGHDFVCLRGSCREGDDRISVKHFHCFFDLVEYRKNLTTILLEWCNSWNNYRSENNDNL